MIGRRSTARLAPGVEVGTIVLARVFAQILIAVMALLAARPAMALEAVQPISELVHTAWSLKESAPSGVWQIAQTAQGDLWLATGEGAYRFDGVHFEQFNAVGRSSLLTEMLDDLFVTPAGDIWIGYHGGGISRFQGGRITSYVKGIPPGPIKRIAQGPDGAVWAATFGGVAVFRNGAWQSLPWSPEFGRAYNLLVARDGLVWIAAEHALLYVRPGSNTVQKTTAPVDGTWAFVQAPDGRLWLSDDKWGLRALEPAQLLRPSGPPPLAKPRKDALRARVVIFDRDGRMWGSYESAPGIFRILHPERIAANRPVRADEVDDTFGAKDGLTSNTASPLFEDREGDVWVGTQLGLDRFRQADVNVSNTIAKDSREGYRAGVSSTGELYVADEDTIYRAAASADFKKIAHDPWHPDEFCPGHDGSLWLTDKAGLSHITGDQLVSVSLPAAARRGETFTCTVDSKGAVWLSVLGVGLFNYRDGVWHGPISIPSKTPLYPRLLVAERSGGLWAYDRGVNLVLYKNGNARTFSDAQGLRIGEIKTLVSNPSGTFVGGELGLARFEGDRFQSVTTDRYPNLGIITGVAQDAEGDTWLSSIHGVIKLRTAELLQALKSPGRLLAMRRFDFRDGVPGMSQQSCCHGTAFTAKADRIWFITSRGVAWVEPARLTFNALPPPVLIRAMTVNGRTLAPQDIVMQFPQSVENLRFDFAAPSLAIPERVRFLYRLEGIDPGWTNPGERRQAFYNNLAPGHYRFRVIAANNDGVWNNTGASVAFVIPPTFVQTPFFFILCGLAAAGLLTLAYLWRSRQIAGRLRDRLEARLKERERIARDLHDTLLQGVQGLVLRFGAIAVSAPQGGLFRYEMDEALARGAQIIGESRDHILELRTTGSSKALIQRFERIGVEFESRSDARLLVASDGEQRELTTVVLEEVGKIGGEAIRNAFEHAYARAIVVEVIYDPDVLRLQVHDDGLGLTEEILRSGQRAGHFGLPGMFERARRVGAKLTLANRDGLWLELTVPARMAYEGQARVWERRRLVRAERAQE